MRHKSTIVCLAMVFVMLAGVANAGILPEVIGYAQIVNGEVFAMNEDPAVMREHDHMKVRQLFRDSPLYMSDVIIAGATAKCQVFFVDGMTLVVGEGSAIALSEFSYDFENKDANSLVFNMGPGLFRFITGKIVEKNADDFAMETPLGVLGIRGTQVMVEAKILEVDVNSLVGGFSSLGVPGMWKNPTIDFKNRVNDMFGGIDLDKLLNSRSEQETIAHLTGKSGTPLSYLFRDTQSATIIPRGMYLIVTGSGPGELMPIDMGLRLQAKPVAPAVVDILRAEFLSRFSNYFNRGDGQSHYSCSP